MPLLTFFLTAFGFSWLFWIPAAINGTDVSRFPGELYLWLGGAGPFIAALLHVFRASPEYRRDYWQRLINFQRAGWRWILTAVFIIPVFTLLAGLLQYTLGGTELNASAATVLQSPLKLIALLISTLFFGPLPEEMAWRGYALGGLLKRFSPLKASLLLGTIWTIWHLPLFWMDGSFQQTEVGFDTLAFVWFCTGTLIGSIVYTWLFQRSNNSTLTAVLFHFSTNLVGQLVGYDLQIIGYQSVLMIAAAALLMVSGQLAPPNANSSPP